MTTTYTIGNPGHSTVPNMMTHPEGAGGARKRIALIAHDNKKPDLAEWARYNRDVLGAHDLVATGTTGLVLEDQLGLPVRRVLSGPLGGDQQIGAMIAEGAVDLLVFFADPLQPMPHDPDVKALLRLAMVWNIPVACNRASADYLVSSTLMSDGYEPLRPSYQATTDSLVP